VCPFLQRAAASLVLLVTGCGGTNAAPTSAASSSAGSSVSVPLPQDDLLGIAEPHSGSRLVLDTVTLEDGTRDVIGIRDTALGVRCAFRRDLDPAQVWRCVPIDYTEFAEFADAGCQTRVASLPPGCAVSMPYFDGRDFYLPAGPVVERTIYYDNGSGNGGACASPAPHTQTVDIGERIPWSSFVAGRLVTVGDGRMRVQMMEGDDGSRTMFTYHDGGLDTDCTFVRQGGGAVCLPSDHHVVETLYRDAACTEPVAAVLASDPSDEPRYASHVALESCAGWIVHAVGPSLGTVYAPSKFGCNAVGLGFAVGPDITAQLYSVPLPYGVNRGRIARTLIEDEDAGAVGRVAWFDTKRDESCDFQAGADGVLRCLPYLQTSKPAFDSTDCSGALSLATGALKSPTCGEMVKYADTSSPLPPICGAKRHVYGIQSSRDGVPGSTRLEDGTCAATAPNVEYAILTVTEVAASEFAAATESTP
jgi:hypothetical protein